MVAREVWEESGFEVVPRKLIAVFDAYRGGTPLEFFHAYKIIWLCDITGGAPRSSDGTMDVGFISFDNPPEFSWHALTRSTWPKSGRIWKMSAARRRQRGYGRAGTRRPRLCRARNVGLPGALPGP